MKKGALTGFDVAILAGGFGTRLRGALPDTPKILAPIGGRPFLDHLMDCLTRENPRRIVFCLGYLAEQVIDAIHKRSCAPCAIEWIVEPEPAGTGGALRHARARLQSDPTLVLNGDTWIDIDFARFVGQVRKNSAEIGMACVKATDVSRYGSVKADRRGWVQGFSEKHATRRRSGLVNGGVYLFSQAALNRMESQAIKSLERDFLQTAPPHTILSHVESGCFVDFGTPDDYAKAESIVPASRPRQPYLVVA